VRVFCRTKIGKVVNLWIRLSVNSVLAEMGILSPDFRIVIVSEAWQSGAVSRFPLQSFFAEKAQKGFPL